MFTSNLLTTSVFTDACIKIALVELCFEKKTKQSLVEIFTKNTLQDFGNKYLVKNISEDNLGKIDQKRLSRLADFGH